MKRPKYQPKRLARPTVDRAGRYNLYILPGEPGDATPEDLERFPPVPLGDEQDARDWLKRVPKPGPRHRWWEWVLYAALGLLLLGVIFLRSASGAPTRVLGFSAMQVLTDSMGDVIPQGSLIITRAVDPATLQVGDDITYLSGRDATVTHRIVDIAENYMGTGTRAFTTQGVENPTPDHLRVPEENVVGKVVFHSLVLGKVLGFLRRTWIWLLILLVLAAGLARALAVVAQEKRGSARERGAQDGKKKADRRSGPGAGPHRGSGPPRDPGLAVHQPGDH